MWNFASSGIGPLDNSPSRPEARVQGAAYRIKRERGGFREVVNEDRHIVHFKQSRTMDCGILKRYDPFDSRAPAN